MCRAGILTLLSLLNVTATFSADTLDADIQNLAQTLTGEIQNRGTKKLAAFDFVDIRGYRSALDAYIAEELVTQVMRTAPGRFTFVERRQLGRILDEQKLTASQHFDEATLANVGKILGLDTILTGSIADLGKVLRVNARAVAVQTGEVYAAASVTITKEGAVAELLRQNGRPEEPLGVDSSGTRRTVQATDVFFENHLIRLTVANANVSPDKHNITMTLILENLATKDLLLALPTTDAMGGCGMAINNGRGDLIRVKRFGVAGLPCIHAENRVSAEMFSSVAPRSRSTITARVFSQEAPGNLIAISIEFLNFVNGKAARFSAGIANIEMK